MKPDAVDTAPQWAAHFSEFGCLFDPALDHPEFGQVVVLIELHANFIPDLQVRTGNPVQNGCFHQVPILNVRPRMNRKHLVMNFLNDSRVGSGALLKAQGLEVS